MALFNRTTTTRKSLDDLEGSAVIETAIDRITGGTLAYCHNGGGGGPKFEAAPIDWNPAMGSGLDLASPALSGGMGVRGL